jgi:hypothetical protein
LNRSVPVTVAAAENVRGGLAQARPSGFCGSLHPLSRGFYFVGIKTTHCIRLNSLATAADDLDVWGRSLMCHQRPVPCTAAGATDLYAARDASLNRCRARAQPNRPIADTTTRAAWPLGAVQFRSLCPNFRLAAFIRVAKFSFLPCRWSRAGPCTRSEID